MIISTRLLVIALFPIFHKLFQISFEVKLRSGIYHQLLEIALYPLLYKRCGDFLRSNWAVITSNIYLCISF